MEAIFASMMVTATELLTVTQMEMGNWMILNRLDV
jgi:hypothetical protein